MRRLAASVCILTVGLVACGGQTVEPMPDIPEKTVDYETVNMEYGKKDGVQPGTSGNDQSKVVRQKMVGATSGLALLARLTVFRTNRLIYGVFWLKEQVLKQRPLSQRGDRYTWVGWPDGNYVEFRLEVVSENSHEYTMWYGNNGRDKAVIFRGTFTRLGGKGDSLEGYGLLTFDFDALAKYRDRPERGEIRLAFRSRNGVRQVRVLYDKFAGEKVDALNTYTQLPGGRTRFEFFGRSDWETDQSEQKKLEFFSADAAWLEDRSGRVAARIEGGNLDQPSEMKQCWDATETVVWETSMPSLPGNGGSKSDCADAVEMLQIEPPSYSQPPEKPQVPAEHAQE